MVVVKHVSTTPLWFTDRRRSACVDAYDRLAKVAVAVSVIDGACKCVLHVRVKQRFFYVPTYVKVNLILRRQVRVNISQTSCTIHKQGSTIPRSHLTDTVDEVRFGLGGP